MKIVQIEDYGNEVVLHFGSDRHSINAYTLASSLVAIADSFKSANSEINPGFEIEVSVDSFSSGSFRVSVITAYKSSKDLFSKEDVKQIVIGVIAGFIVVMIWGGEEPNISIDDNQVIIQHDDQKIIVPKSVYEAQRRVAKSKKFRESISKTFEALYNDQDINSFGFSKSQQEEETDFKIKRKNFLALLEQGREEADRRVIFEHVELQITKAILDRSKKKWGFVWNGLKISAMVTDEKFHDNFIAHEITIAPGDILEVNLKINQKLDENSKIFLNEYYEVVEVYNFKPLLRPSILD